MSNMVIVAIPAADDPVWKVSSEKVPHLTLLFLGPLEPDDNTQRMADFIEHAVEVSEHGPFYLEVDYRDKLGDDNADVLFFKDGRSLKWVNSFRSQLLQQNDIRAEFEEQEAAGNQFPEWQPHLTLGYPTAPAKPLPNDYPLYSVCFDRIALWTGDYEGPEFRLEWPERDSADYPSLAYADTGKAAVEDLLHVGVKGMRWGIRRAAKDTTVTVNGKAKQVTAKKANKLDKKWQKNQFTLSKGIERHNAMAEHFNSRIGTINDKHPSDFSKEAHDNPAKWSPAYKKYMGEVHALQAQSFKHAVKEVHGTSPTGKLKMDVEMHKDGLGAQMVVKNVDQAQHAAIDTGDEVFLFKVIRDPSGLITSIAPVNDLDEGGEVALEQTALGKQFVLTHTSVLDNSDVAKQIKAKIQDILDDVDGDTDGDVALFGDPLIRAKLQSVLEDFYKDPNVDNALAYGALGEVFLQHYGVLGMKWGRRSASSHLSTGGKVSRLRKEGDALHNQAKTAHPSKAAALRAKGDEKHKQANALEKKAKDYLKGPDAVAPKATSIVPHGEKRKTKIEADGGQNHPAHEDALKVARAHEKLKKSGPSALSNQELRDVANRILLEKQVGQLTGNKGKQWVTGHLRGQGDDLTRQVARTGIRKGITKAGVAALL